MPTIRPNCMEGNLDSFGLLQSQQNWCRAVQQEDRQRQHCVPRCDQRNMSWYQSDLEVDVDALHPSFLQPQPTRPVEHISIQLCIRLALDIAEACRKCRWKEVGRY